MKTGTPMQAAVVLLSLVTAAVAEDADVYKLPDRARDYATDQANYNVASGRVADLEGKVIRERQAAITKAHQSDEYRAAVDATRTLNENYQATRRRVQAELAVSNAQYKALLAQRDAVDAELEAARNSENKSYDALSALYKKKEGVTNQMRQIETAAMESAGAIETRKRWEDSTRQVEAMNQKARTDAETATGVVQTKEQLEQARRATQEAYVKLEGSSAAYDEAAYQQEKVDDYRSHYAPGIDYWGDSYGYSVYYRPRYWGGGVRIRR